MIRVLPILLLLLTPFALPEPTLVATWETPHRLVIVASPGSLYLRGGHVADQYIGMEAVTLTDQGTDDAYNPTTRDAIVLKNQSGIEIAVLPIPLKPKVYQVILPIVAIPA